MSWCSHITTVRPIDMADAKDIVASMSPDLAGEGAGRQQAWGWSCAVDVHYPIGSGWGIGGSHSSVGIALVVERFLVDALRKRGYEPVVSYRSTELIAHEDAPEDSFKAYIHAPVAVALSPSGEAIWRLFHPDRNCTTDGTLRTTLFELMRTFGPVLNHTNPFLGEIIRITK